MADLENEEWRWAKGLEGKLKVSNCGRLVRFYKKALAREINKGGKFGVYSVCGVRFHAHRMIAETFLPNPDNLPIVLHKDGNKNNNHVSNLEWSAIKAWCNTPPMLGKHHTEETKQKMRKPHKPLSEETRRRMSEAQRRRYLRESNHATNTNC